MCSRIDNTFMEPNVNNRLSDISTIYGPDSGRGGWQGGDYQNLLAGERNSCDSSIYAWSEDGHRSHIEAKKKSVSSRSDQKRKRSSAIVGGTLVMQKSEQEKQHLSVPTSFPQLPSTANSGSLSASFSSPLLKFPSTPARSQAGQLVLQAPRSSLMPAPLPNIRAQSPLIRQLSQDTVQNSPVDVASIVASGWAIEPEEYSDEYNSEAASALIDSLLHGVQEGFLSSAVVDSPTRMTEIDDNDDDSQAGWETDDCEITPRLRKVWQDVDSPSATSRSNSVRSSRVAAQQSKFSESSGTISSTQSSKVQRQSFIRVPSAIFPHTPSQAKAGKRVSIQSISSISSRSSSRSKQSRASLCSMLSESDKGVKRRSIHLAAVPSRPMSRKSKYYSRPTQPGAMPLLKQQHLKGARGKFWSPMNSLCIANDEDAPNVEDFKVRQSSRYSRRSGQAWLRPRTFEVKDQYRVTIYPPQVDDFYSRKVLQADPDKTPTQALFKAAAASDPPRPVSRASKRASSVSRTLPPGPPPTRQLPAVPVLESAPRKTKRLSRGARYSQCTVTSTITSGSCSQCQSDISSCSCSESLTEESKSSRASTYSGTYSDSQTEGYTESQSCSCTDASTCSCTMTRSSMISSQVESMSTPKQSYFGYRERVSLDKASRVLGLPNSAPLFAPSGQSTQFAFDEQPRSAPYFSTAHPPILDPLPNFSPFQVSFDDILGSKRRSKRWTRYSMSDASSRTSMSSSRCSMCVGSSELAYLGSKSEAAGTTSDGTIIVSSSMSYDSDSKSSSSSSPMSDLASDHGSENDSDMPTTPTRSEYQSTYGLSESPGMRMSFIVSPMPQSARRHSQMEELLTFSPRDEECNDNKTEESRMSALRPISQFTSTTFTGTTTTSSTCNSRAPRSILKTSRNYRECDQGVTHRRPTVSMAVDTVFKSGSSTFSGRIMSTSTSSSSYSSSASSSTRAPASHAPQRATLATSTMTKHDLEGRIQREENRRKRNESRLYALEKLEGKTKKSSLFFSLLSNASSTASGGGAGIWNEGEQEEEFASPLPQTPLTPAKMDLLELQRQVENRQRITQFQNNKAVSFTDVIGFDMGTYPKIPSRDDAASTSQEQDALLKLQLRKLSTAIEARQYAKDKCIDK